MGTNKKKKQTSDDVASAPSVSSQKKEKKAEKKRAKQEKKQEKQQRRIDKAIEGIEKLSVSDQDLELNDEQKEALKQLREIYRDRGITREYSDETLIKFLRCRKFDVERAVGVLKNYCDWYDAAGIEKLNIVGVRRMLERYVILLPDARDLEGRTVLYMRPNDYEPSSIPYQELMATVVYLLEIALESPLTQVHGFSFLATMDGWGWNNFSMAYASTFFSTLQSRFPARVGKFILVDCPWWFHAVWRVIRPMMSAKFASRVVRVTRKELPTLVDVNSLTEELGGQSTFTMREWIKERYRAEGFEWTEELPPKELTARIDGAKAVTESGSDRSVAQ